MSTIVSFEIPANDIQRARNFYSNVFGWKIDKSEGDYWMFDTKAEKGHGSTPGGLYQREEPGLPIVDYVGVASVDDVISKIEKNGGKIVTAKTSTPHWGYYAIVKDAEGNLIGLWQEDKKAK